MNLVRLFLFLLTLYNGFTGSTFAMNNNVQGLKKKIALIITTKDDHNGRFLPQVGFYRRDCKHLQENGYEIVSLTPESETDLNKQVEKLEDLSIGFVWIRAHGYPTFMRFVKDTFEPTASFIKQNWTWLVNKLHPSATIYLDSCDTGKPIKNIEANVQFAFAILTLDFPEVTIIAPKEGVHVSSFAVTHDGRFLVSMINSPGDKKNLALVVGAKTKEILKKAQESMLSREKLIDSIETGKEITHFLQKNEYETLDVHNIEGFLIQTHYDVEATFFEIMRYYQHPKHYSLALDQVKYLVEALGASINKESCSKLITGYAGGFNPLFCAVDMGNLDVVRYLLERKADATVCFKDISLRDFAQSNINKTNNEEEERVEVIKEEKLLREKIILLIEQYSNKK